ncbi:MAG: hypothetical protein ACI8Z1_002838 [Candidatus Azotimanducaceae bacterium]|jgi:hypothetical protein
MGIDKSNRLKQILSGRTLVEKHGGLYASIILTMICILVSVAITSALHWIVNGWGTPFTLQGIITPIAVPILVALPATRYTFGLMEQLIHSEISNQQLVTNLRAALGDVQQLSGLLPICAYCKDIEDGRGDWHTVEAYVGQHSKVHFSHGLCPDCAETLYPDNSTSPEN